VRVSSEALAQEENFDKLTRNPSWPGSCRARVLFVCPPWLDVKRGRDYGSTIV